MNDATPAAQGPPPYSPSSPNEVGDDDSMFDFDDLDDDDGGTDGVGGGPLEASPVAVHLSDAAATNTSTPTASTTCKCHRSDSLTPFLLLLEMPLVPETVPLAILQ